MHGSGSAKPCCSINYFGKSISVHKKNTKFFTGKFKGELKMNNNFSMLSSSYQTIYYGFLYVSFHRVPYSFNFIVATILLKITKISKNGRTYRENSDGRQFL